MAYRRRYIRRFTRRRPRFNRRKLGMGTQVVRRQSGARVQSLYTRQPRVVATRLHDFEIRDVGNWGNVLAFSNSRGPLVADGSGSGQAYFYRSCVWLNQVPHGSSIGSRLSRHIKMISLHLSMSIFYNPQTTGTGNVPKFASTDTSSVDRSYVVFLVYLPDHGMMTEAPEMDLLLQSPIETQSELQLAGYIRPQILWSKRGRLVLDPVSSGSGTIIDYAPGTRSRHDIDVKIPLNLPATYTSHVSGTPAITDIVSGRLLLYCVGNVPYVGAVRVVPYASLRARLAFTSN